MYLTPGRDTASVSESSAGATIRDLVDRSPFVDTLGKLYAGSRQSTAVALDRDTGQILRLVKGEPTGEVQQKESVSLQNRNIVWIGRVDSYVTVYDARSGGVDVEFSASEILSMEDMFSAYVFPRKIEGDLVFPFSEVSSEMAESSLSLPIILSTPGGQVALFNPMTGLIDWVSDETFDTPIVFAVSAQAGTSLGVDIVPDAPLRSSSKSYLKEQFLRQLSALEDKDALVHDEIVLNAQRGCSVDVRTDSSTSSFGKTIVGSLDSGQLFALPMESSVIVKRGMKNGRNIPRRTFSHPATSESHPGRLPLKLFSLRKYNLQDFFHFTAPSVPPQKQQLSAKTVRFVAVCSEARLSVLNNRLISSSRITF